MKLLSYASIATLSCALILSGCADQGGPITKQQAGTVLGAIGGTVVGTQIGGGTGRVIAIAAGALGGALIGSAIGSSLDKADKAYLHNTTNMSLENSPSGQPKKWYNPDSGHGGSVTPLRTYQEHGQYCREFVQTVTIGKKQQEAYGTACRQPDGSWQIIN